MQILKTNNLSKGFFSKKALNQINLELEHGKIYGLLGPNGSGKTTMMRIIAGLIKPTSGSLLVNNHEIGVKTKEIISFMPTDNYLYPMMKIKDLKKYFNDMFNDFNPDKFDSMIKYMDLNQNDKVSALSTGMTGRLKLAIALSRDAKLFLFDEPLNGIDFISREKIIESIVGEMSPEKTMIISSHLVSEMEKILDTAIFIKEGNVELVADVEQIRYEQNKSIEDLYKEVFA
ncbi:ABC transporter ATP-binding protein [Abyssisolibacter fermentans]|uniref:ABC transporter ATP-binding protein n=1 Tax=Abyssisolibacter fermentans TaxID=1766203 RepID=UPI00082F3188|nr:ABC transporter ATP-binding protein [Abyssisolibacter fermentans]